MSSVCHEVGLLIELVSENRARVKIRRAEACHSCSMHSACLTLGGKTQDLYLVVDNQIGAKPGDQVTLTMSEASVIKASAAVYLVPALSLIGGAAAGWQLAQIYGWAADPASIVGAALGLLAGLALSRLAEKLLGQSSSYVPHLTGILGQVRDEIDPSEIDRSAD